MNVNSIGIGLLFTFIVVHACLLLVSWAVDSSIDPNFTVGDPSCAQEMYAAMHQQLCSTASWLQSTPLFAAHAAVPSEGGLTFGQMLALAPAIMRSIMHMVTLNYAILQDVDPVTEFIVTLAKLAPIITMLLLLCSIVHTFVQGITGLVGRRLG